MRKYLLLSMALGALLMLTVGALSTASGETAESGNLKITVDGDFQPHKLSKTKPSPIILSATGKIETKDGTHPPALKEFILETDKSGSINLKGFPVCKKSKLQATDTPHAEKACPTAIVGTGKTTIGIEFEEQPEIDVPSKLLVFNGGVAGGVTTLYIHAYVSKPVQSAIVTTVKIKKIHKGPYGMLSIASIPKIVGGAGSVKTFSLTLNKGLKNKGKRFSALFATCPSGKLQAHGTAVFSDGTRLSAGFVRPCTGTK